MDNNNIEKENTVLPEEEVVETVNESVEAETEEDLHGENLNDRAKVLSPFATVMKRFFRSKLSMIGLVTLIVLFVFSFLGPVFSPWDVDERDTDPNNIGVEMTASPFTYEVDGVTYTAIDMQYTYPEEGAYNKLGGITSQHWMGTDKDGYDVFTRLMYGGRISLTLGFVVVILETIIGVVLGGLAGYYGKWVDNLIMRIVDILSCIPSLPIMLILSAVLQGNDSIDPSLYLYIIMAVLTLIGWTGTARLVRGQILSLREQEFMLAAKASGLSTGRKIFKHLLPNVIPQLIVSMTLGLGSIILMEATLGYLGVGVDPTTATWGNMINTAGDATIRSKFPNLWLGSGVCITLAILAFNFVGDGLRDAFDPKMKR